MLDRWILSHLLTLKMSTRSPLKTIPMTYHANLVEIKIYPLVQGRDGFNAGVNVKGVQMDGEQNKNTAPLSAKACATKLVENMEVFFPFTLTRWFYQIMNW